MKVHTVESLSCLYNCTVFVFCFLEIVKKHKTNRRYLSYLKSHPFFPFRAMSSLYRDPQRSTKISGVISRLLGSEVGTWQGKNFPLTDMWGVLTSAGKQVNLKNK